MRRIIVLTGNGKGKTSSAIGASVRALGRDFRVLFYQFIKSPDVDYGEHVFFKNGRKLKMLRFGLGCRKDFNYSDQDKKAAVNGLKKISKELCSVKTKNVLCVMDEISYPVNWSWFSVKEVVKIIKDNKNVNFILTGRDMPKELIEISDTVSEVKEVKHAYQKGQKAQKGIEF
jgi:cob(I)alamin adenosyltransferase